MFSHAPALVPAQLTPLLASLAGTTFCLQTGASSPCSPLHTIASSSCLRPLRRPVQHSHGAGLRPAHAGATHEDDRCRGPQPGRPHCPTGKTSGAQSGTQMGCSHLQALRAIARWPCKPGHHPSLCCATSSALPLIPPMRGRSWRLASLSLPACLCWERPAASGWRASEGRARCAAAAGACRGSGGLARLPVAHARSLVVQLPSPPAAQTLFQGFEYPWTPMHTRMARTWARAVLRFPPAMPAASPPLRRLIPAPVIRGMQLGLGLGLAKKVGARRCWVGALRRCRPLRLYHLLARTHACAAASQQHLGLYMPRTPPAPLLPSCRAGLAAGMVCRWKVGPRAWLVGPRGPAPCPLCPGPHPAVRLPR